MFVTQPFYSQAEIMGFNGLLLPDALMVRYILSKKCNVPPLVFSFPNMPEGKASMDYSCSM